MATGYIPVAIQREERDLMSLLGEDYRAYRTRTSMIMPLPQRGAK
jgi:protein-S-isoprenylcysteine O-methyltransferase Ste14